MAGNLCLNMVDDRTTKFKIIYKIMGLKNIGYLLAQIIFNFLLATFLLLICFFFTLLQKSIMKKNLEIDFCYKIFFLGMILFLQVIFFNMILSYIFKRPKLARDLGSWINIIMIFVASYLVFVSQNNFLRFFLPYQSFIRFLYFSFINNKIEIDFSWSEEIAPMIIQSIIEMVLLFYIDAVYPSEDDHRRSYFFFLDYFKKKSPIFENNDLEQNLIVKNELVIKNISKNFGSFSALKNIDIELKKGETICLLGHNGAGKSTLINILTGIYKPTSGKIIYKNKNFRDLQIKNKIKIGICPSYNTLFDTMTVYQHLKMISIIKNITNKEKKIIKISKELNLVQFLDKNIKTLSGGYVRRVTMAIALINDPDFLFLDEPTSAIDANSRREIWDSLTELKKSRVNTITFLTTHHLEEAELLADQINVLVKGEIFAKGSVEDLKKEFGVGYQIDVFSKNEEFVCEKFFDDLKNILIKFFELTEFNFRIKKRKMFIIIPINKKKEIKKILEIIEKKKPSQISFSINSNTLEKAYIEIENQASKKDIIYTTEEIKKIMFSLYTNKKANFFYKLYKIAIFKLKFISKDILQFIFLLSFYIIFAVGLFFVLKIYSDHKVEINFTIIASFLTVFVLLETSLYSFLVYEIVYEKTNLIKMILISQKTSFLAYYGGKFIIDILLTLILYTISYTFFYYSINKFAPTVLDKGKLEFAMLQIFFRKLSFCSFCYVFSLLFENPKKSLKYFVLVYYGYSLIVMIIVVLTNFPYLLIFSDLYFFFRSFGTRNSYFFIGCVIQIVCCFTILYVKQIYDLKYNYIKKNKISQQIDNNEEENDFLNLNLKESVKKEKKETISNENRELRVIELNKYYKKNHVVKNVNFGIDKKCNLGLLGPNGAGKSTIVNMILNKTLKTSGNLNLKNHFLKENSFKNYFQGSIYDKNSFGIVFQNNSLWEKFRAGEIISLFANFNGIDKKNLLELIKYFKFDFYLKKTVEELSSGNQRKLCILISLLNNPDIIIYDEATCGVDLIMRLQLKDILDYFKEKNNSIGIYTTHFLKDIEIFCDKLMMIRDGKILFIEYIDKLKNFIGGYKLTFFFKELDRKEKIIEMKEEIERFVVVREFLFNFNKYGSHNVEFHFNSTEELSGLLGFVNEMLKEEIFNEFSLNQFSMDDIYLEIMRK